MFFYNCFFLFHGGECPRVKLKLNGRKFVNLEHSTLYTRVSALCGPRQFTAT